MFACADVMQLTMSPRKLAGRKFPLKIINAVLNEETGEIIEYRQVIKNPKYRKLYEKSFSKEIGRLAQGMPGQAEGTGKNIFIDKANVPVDRWREVTYVRIVLSYKPENTTHTDSGSQ